MKSIYEEVASCKLVTQKNQQDFVYEIKLIAFISTEEYQLHTRWYYKTNSKQLPGWKVSKWDRKGKEKYLQKIEQKTKRMNYKIEVALGSLG